METQQFLPEDFNGEPKKLTKEEVEKIYSKYTKHFSEYLNGEYNEEEDNKDEEE